MLDQFADYTVLELIIGERLVHYLEITGWGIYALVLAYSIQHMLRYNARRKRNKAPAVESIAR